MVIRQLLLKNFGKFHDMSLELKPGMNIVYGENESGKSTVHAFIKGMFFGIRRMRGRASKTDEYSRYAPWENPGWYEGAVRFECGGKSFRLERNFCRGEGGAKLICETDGELLSVEDGDLEILLGGISQTAYENTVSVGQMKSRTGEGLLQELRNYLSNYQGSGDGTLDVEKALSALKEKRKKWLILMQERGQQQDKEEEKLRYEIQYLQREHEELQEKLQEELRKAKAENEDRGERLQDSRRQENKRQDVLRKKLTAAGVVLTLMVFGILAYMAGPIKAVIPALATAVLAFVLTCRFGGHRGQADLPEDMRERDSVIRLLRSQEEDKKTRISNLREELLELQQNFSKENREKDEIRGIELASRTILELAASAQKSAGDALKQRISEIFSTMTDGRYEKVSIDEDLKMNLFTKERCVPLFMASQGTVEQVYLALRIAVGDILCKEEPLPLLVDEVFAMYDEKRLAETLRWLVREREQVVLFTCNKREMETLTKNGIPYNLVRLY